MEREYSLVNSDNSLLNDLSDIGFYNHAILKYRDWFFLIRRFAPNATPGEYVIYLCHKEDIKINNKSQGPIYLAEIMYSTKDSLKDRLRFVLDLYPSNDDLLDAADFLMCAGVHTE